MVKSLVLINFKTYVIGKKALSLTQNLSKAQRSGYEVVLAPSLLDLAAFAKDSSLPICAQHVDPCLMGSHTGNIPIDFVSSLGVWGTLLNHSEHKLSFEVLSQTLLLCKKYKLTTVVCASTLHEVEKIATLHPDYLAYEPAELIGKDRSVTKAKPDVIVLAVEQVKKISPKTKFLCGAGIRSSEDLGQALLLGTSGVLLSHAVVESKNPQKVLEEMLL